MGHTRRSYRMCGIDYLLSAHCHKQGVPRYILYGPRQQRTRNCYSINCDDHSDSTGSSQNILRSTRVKQVIRIGPAAMACVICVYTHKCSVSVIY